MDSNSELTSIFENWLINPREDLDFEIKTWLNLNEQSARAKIAKELIALENHWWWYLIIWFDDQTMLPDENNRPQNLDQYNTDNINSIIDRFAEPKFHVDVTIQLNPKDWKYYPFIRTLGTTQVPIRSRSDDAEKTIIRNNCYYIRRPWPTSDMPKDWIEWDQLIYRCVKKQRREISEMIASFMSNWWVELLPEVVRQKKDEDLLSEFIKLSLINWNEENNNLPLDSPSKNKFWYHYFSSRIIWRQKTWISMRQIKDKIYSFKKYTGWPIFITIRNDIIPVSDNLEFSLLNQWFEADHSDFWRINKDWMSFILRWYQSDCRDDYKEWEVFDYVIPTWRLWEYLLHVTDLASFLYEDWFQVLLDVWWTGLKNRRLVSLDSWSFFFWKYICHDDSYNFKGLFSSNELQDLLPLVSQKVISWLLEKFDLFTQEYEFYQTQIEKMRNWIR